MLKIRPYWVGVWVSGIDVTVSVMSSTMLFTVMLSLMVECCTFSIEPLSPRSIHSLLVSCVGSVVVHRPLASLSVDAKGVEFSQCPLRRDRQFRQSLPAFLQAQFLHRPLTLHRQHTTGMPQNTQNLESYSSILFMRRRSSQCKSIARVRYAFV